MATKKTKKAPLTQAQQRFISSMIQNAFDAHLQSEHDVDGGNDDDRLGIVDDDDVSRFELELYDARREIADLKTRNSALGARIAAFTPPSKLRSRLYYMSENTQEIFEELLSSFMPIKDAARELCEAWERPDGGLVPEKVIALSNMVKAHDLNPLNEDGE